jgi:hypothetical protein
MRMRWILFLWAALIGGGTAMAADELPRQYSADMEVEAYGQTMALKVFMDEGKARSEMEMPGAMQGLGLSRLVTIARPDLGKVYLLYPDTKTYEEQPLRPGDTQISAATAPGADTEPLGTEMVNGVPSKKYQVSYSGQTMWVWTSVADGVPVKMQSVDGSTLINVKNVRLGPQPASLFEVPAGYKLGQGIAGNVTGMIEGLRPGMTAPGSAAGVKGKPVTREDTEEMIRQMPPELAEQFRKAMNQLPPPRENQSNRQTQYPDELTR